MFTISNTSRTTLTNKQAKALQLILGGSTVKDVARETRVSRKTVYSWYEMDHFTQALAKEKAIALERLSQNLASLSDKAVKTLVDLMDDPNSNIRLRAADIILLRNLEVKDTVEFESRINALETFIENNKSGELIQEGTRD